MAKTTTIDGKGCRSQSRSRAVFPKPTSGHGPLHVVAQLCDQGTNEKKAGHIAGPAWARTP